MARKIGVSFLLIALVLVFLGQPALAESHFDVLNVETREPGIVTPVDPEEEALRHIRGGKGERPAPLPLIVNQCPVDYSNLIETFLWAVGVFLVKLGIDLATDLGIGAKIIGIGGEFHFDLDMITQVLNKWLTAIFWGLIASLSLFLSGILLEVAIAINFDLLNENALIGTGFPIMLGIANIGFILILIAAGLMTIIGIKDWGKWRIETVGPRLLIAILLINFSLFIAKIISDISMTIMRAFVGERCIGNTLFNFFNLGRINESLEILLWGRDLGGLSGALSSALTIWLASLLIIIAALTVIALVAFLFARYIVLSLFIIFMPIAWLGLAAPGLKIPGIEGASDPWAFWWNTFLKWIIFGPLIAFLLYLNVVFLAGMTTTPDVIRESPDGIRNLLQLIGFVIINLGGLFMINKAGGIASTVMKGAGGLAISGIQGLGGVFQKRAAMLEERAQRIEKADPNMAARLRRSAKKSLSFSQITTFPSGKISEVLSNEALKFKPPKPPEINEKKEKQIKDLARRRAIYQLPNNPAALLQLNEEEIETALKNPQQKKYLEGAAQNLVEGFSDLNPDQQKNYAKAIRKMKDRDLVREAVLAKGNATAIINLLTNEDHTAINTDPKFAHNRTKISEALAGLINPTTKTRVMDSLTLKLDEIEKARFKNRFDAIPRNDIGRMILDLIPTQPDVVLSLTQSDLRNFTDPNQQKTIEDGLKASTIDPSRQKQLQGRINKLKNDNRWIKN